MAMLLWSGAAHAQWSVVAAPSNSPDYTNGVTAGCDDLQFIDDNTGFLVASALSGAKFVPVFLKTTTGGPFEGAKIAELGNIPSGTRVRVHMLDAMVGHVAAGKIARTTDGGTTWTLVTLPMGAAPEYVWTLSGTRAVASGTGGTLLTTDGTTWNQVDQAGGALLFFDDMIGLAAGGARRTTDGGATWSPATGPASNGPWARASATVAYVLDVTNRKVSRTTDAGLTWSTPTSIPNCAPMSIAFATATRGFIGCTGGAPGVNTLYNLGTSDGGATWQQEAWPQGWPANTGSGINGVRCASFPSENAGYGAWDFYERRPIKRGPFSGGGGADMSGGGGVDMRGGGGSEDMAGGGGDGGGGGGGGGCSVGGVAVPSPLVLALFSLLALRRRRRA